MTTNTLNDGLSILMCCNPDKVYSPSSICYRNGSSFTEGMILPDTYDSNFSITTTSPAGLMRGQEFSCNGTIHDLKSYLLKNDRLQFTVNVTDYCFTSNLTDNGTKNAVFVCVPSSDTNALYWEPRPLFYTLTVGLSLPFLAATFLAYTVIPELKNVHGSILRAFVACLFYFYILDIVINIDLRYLCIYFIDITLHFSALSSFSWMNVMGFDIWWTFREFKSLRSSSKQRNSRKFIFYSIYAWGSSALVTGVGSILDNVPYIPYGIIKPGFREDICWFTTTAAGAIYLYGPMAITIVSNAYFFLSTTMRIIRHEKDTAHHLYGHAERRRNDEKKRFKLYLKLFILMGITWSAEFVIWQYETVLPQYITNIINLPNNLQGISIFVIFIWKDKTKRLLLKHLGWKSRGLRTTTSSDGTYRSSQTSTCSSTTSCGDSA